MQPPAAVKAGSDPGNVVSPIDRPPLIEIQVQFGTGILVTANDIQLYLTNKYGSANPYDWSELFTDGTVTVRVRAVRQP